MVIDAAPRQAESEQTEQLPCRESRRFSDTILSDLLSKWNCRYCTTLNEKRDRIMNANMVWDIICRRNRETESTNPHFCDIIDTDFYIPCKRCLRHQNKMKNLELVWVYTSFFLFKFIFLYPIRLALTVPLFVFSWSKNLAYQLFLDYLHPEVKYTRRRLDVHEGMANLFKVVSNPKRDV